MAYDALRGVTVLFGGFASNGSSGDTWEWNGTVWTQRAVSGPSARSDHAMVYDALRGVTVLFGGRPSGSSAGDGETWEWDGTTWTQRVVSGPSPRYGHAMAYDARRGVTVLFGGSAGSGETWEWNGTVWTQRAVSGPSARSGHAMAYDSLRGATVLFGGYTPNYSEDTFEWNGTAWTRRSDFGPVGRGSHAMAYDMARGVTVLFAGYNNRQYSIDLRDTWGLGVPCVAPGITVQPVAQTACPAGPASFVVTAAGTGLFEYQWQVESPAGSGIYADIVGPTFTEPATGLVFDASGATNDTLVVSNITLGTHPDLLRFRAAVSNACGSATSGPAALMLCAADADCDGFVTGDDFSLFVLWFETGDPRGDFDGDGFITGDDFSLFVTAFELGC